MDNKTIETAGSQWVNLATVLSALFGGGVITWIFDIIRTSKKNKVLRNLLAFEITRNIDIMDTDHMREHAWIPQKMWSTFYDANPTAIMAFKDKNKAKKIVQFYQEMENLRMLDEQTWNELRSIEEQNRFFEVQDKGTHISRKTELDREGTGRPKAKIREEMIKLGREIIQDRD
jgi:pyruvate carboxylase